MIFATHRDLDAMQSEGRFRKDLYYRLHAHRIQIPCLRDRFDDLPLLVDFFLNNTAMKLGKNKPAYPKELIDLLGTYDFPGNIRELKNMVFDAVSKHKTKTLSMESFKSYIKDKRPNHQENFKVTPETTTPFASLANLPTLKESGHLLILEALNRANGNQAIAAEMLGITRQALNWRLKQCDKSD